VILTDREIQISLDRRIFSISPAPESVAYTSTAVDLTLDPILHLVRDPTSALETTINPQASGFNAEDVMGRLSDQITIDQQSGYPFVPLGWTKERIEMDVEARIAARVEGKSSLARLGLVIHITAPTIHAGFKGRIRLEMMNHGAVPIRLWPGMRICQLIFETTLGTAEKGYKGQFAGQGI
jgi:dCTP deaminase